MRGSHKDDRAERPEALFSRLSIRSTVVGNRHGDVGSVRSVRRAAKRCRGHFTHEIQHVEWNDRSRVGTTFPSYR